MSIIKHVTLQTIVAHDFRYDPRIYSDSVFTLKFMVNPRCVRLKKCGLFSDKHNGMACRKHLCLLNFELIHFPPAFPFLRRLYRLES